MVTVNTIQKFLVETSFVYQFENKKVYCLKLTTNYKCKDNSCQFYYIVPFNIADDRFYDALNFTAYNCGFFDITNYYYIRKFYYYSLAYHWTKIIFKGKGFRIRKTKKSRKLTFNFGKSHWTKLLLMPNIWIINKIKRQLYFLYTSNKSYFYLLKDLLKNIRKVNKYTLRGLRLKKQAILRRFGKISQVNSVLNK